MGTRIKTYFATAAAATIGLTLLARAEEEKKAAAETTAVPEEKAPEETGKPVPDPGVSLDDWLAEEEPAPPVPPEIRDAVEPGALPEIYDERPRRHSVFADIIPEEAQQDAATELLIPEAPKPKKATLAPVIIPEAPKESASRALLEGTAAPIPLTPEAWSVAVEFGVRAFVDAMRGDGNSVVTMPESPHFDIKAAAHFFNAMMVEAQIIPSDPYQSYVSTGLHTEQPINPHVQVMLELPFTLNVDAANRAETALDPFYLTPRVGAEVALPLPTGQTLLDELTVGLEFWMGMPLNALEGNKDKPFSVKRWGALAYGQTQTESFMQGLTQVNLRTEAGFIHYPEHPEISGGGFVSFNVVAEFGGDTQRDTNQANLRDKERADRAARLAEDLALPPEPDSKPKPKITGEAITVEGKSTSSDKNR